MDPVSRQRGETWTSKDRRRTEFQHKFAICWIGVTVGSLLLSIALISSNITLTREVLMDTIEVDGEAVYRSRIFTGYRWYDEFAMAIAWLGVLFLLWKQWVLKRSKAQLVTTLRRNLPVTAAFFLCRFVLNRLVDEQWIGFRPSGHYLVYVSASYLHYHNAKAAVTDVDSPWVALALLANIPYMMYAAVWTALVFHTVVEVSFGALLALSLTYISHLLQFDK